MLGSDPQDRIFQGGEIIGALVSHVPLKEANTAAGEGLLRHDADFGRLIDIDRSPAEVWSKRRESP